MIVIVLSLLQVQLIVTSIISHNPVMLQYMSNGFPHHLTINNHQRLLHFQSKPLNFPRQAPAPHFIGQKENSDIINLKMSPVTWIVGSRGFNGKPVALYQRILIL